MRILLVEDNSRLAGAVAKSLSGFGFGVDVFATAEDAWSALKSISYDAAVLDLGLPDRDGLDLLVDFRQEHRNLPVLILTARDSIEDRVTGLDAGADDYLVKPFAMTELAARLRALLRRPGQALTTTLHVGNLHLDVGSRQVKVDKSSIHIPLRELKALELLMRREGQVIPKSSLEDNLYGLTKHVSPNSIEVLISRLRRRLGVSGASCSIHTLQGIGYLLKES